MINNKKILEKKISKIDKKFKLKKINFSKYKIFNNHPKKKFYNKKYLKIN